MRKFFLLIAMMFIMPSSIFANGETYTEPRNLHMYNYIQQPTSEPLGYRALMSVAPLSATATSDDVGFTETPAYQGYFDAVDSYSLSKPEMSALIDNDLSTFATSLKSSDVLKIVLDTTIDIKSFYLNKDSQMTYVQFNDAEDKSLLRTSTRNKEIVEQVNLKDVKSILFFANGYYWPTNIYEFDIYQEFVYIPVKNLNVTNKDDNSISFGYDIPKNEDGSTAKLLIDGNVVNTNTYTANNLLSDTEYTFNFVVVYNDGTEIIKEYKVKTDKDTTAPDNVSGLQAKITGKKDVLLTYTLPTDRDFSHLKIERDGEVIANNIKTATYTDMLTQYEQKYKYKVIAIDTTGNASDGVTVELTTPEEPELASEVINLKAVPTSSNVKLTWTNTTNEAFETATIYRKTKEDTSLRALFSLFAAGDGYDPLFETNGTMFNDLTVAPVTSYTYLVTTTIAGVESDGVTIDVTTPEVTIEGSDMEEEENGDYTVTWSSPTTGKMQINVGGQPYAVVPASDQTFTVPASDVVYTALGAVDITLTPIDDSGTPTGPTDTIGGGMGGLIGGNIFTAPDLLSAAIALLSLIGLFVLFGLAFRLVPKLIGVIKNAFAGGNLK